MMAAIEPELYLAERLRAEHITPKNLNAWECIVRALALMNTRGRENADKAHDLLQRAISLECQSAQAHSLVSIVTTFRIHMGWINRRQEGLPRAMSLARKAISLNPYEPWAHAALGYALIWKRPDEAILPCRRRSHSIQTLPSAIISSRSPLPRPITAIRFFPMPMRRNGWHDGICSHAPTLTRITTCVQLTPLRSNITTRESNLRTAQFLTIQARQRPIVLSL